MNTSVLQYLADMAPGTCEKMLYEELMARALRKIQALDEDELMEWHDRISEYNENRRKQTREGGEQ